MWFSEDRPSQYLMKKKNFQTAGIPQIPVNTQQQALVTKPSTSCAAISRTTSALVQGTQPANEQAQTNGNLIKAYNDNKMTQNV